MSSKLDVLKSPNIEDEEEYEHEYSRISWSNLIFLPFHPVFKLLVLFTVIVKTILGPLQSIFPLIDCFKTMDQTLILALIKYYYTYCCTAIYGIDTFLHIVHRQVTDKAMRREHLPKSAFLLLLDIIALIPFFRLVAPDLCPVIQLWPNVLAFLEFIIVYRVADYFSMVSTHSILQMTIGIVLLIFISVNCISCFLLLLTMHGLCSRCDKGIYDWRKFVLYKLNDTDAGYYTYVYAAGYTLSFAMNVILDDTKPSTYIEFAVACMLMIISYILAIFIVMPKLFAESILRLRRIFLFHPHVYKIIKETQRRNPSLKSHVNVENFYSLIWRQRSGITSIPQIISELPRYLRLDLRQDLYWALFYHSPTFRKTSMPFKRYLCEVIHLDYKLPGEKFYTGPRSHSNLYYLKSGIVQLISADDGVTPLVSLTSGTILGDISFYLPPLKRRIMVRCLTYCEVFIVSREDILKTLHKFPEDRSSILQNAKERVKHARTLYTCKQHVRGLDRTEDEGIAWVKRRWWEISEAISLWQTKSLKKEQGKFEIPPEESSYHCAKYIGQLVLCSDAQLQKKSMFANVKFPWILLPNSAFVKIWRYIVQITVYLVLILYPPNITRLKMQTWFMFFQFWTDTVYVADILASLLTSIQRQENMQTNFASVLFMRCKNLYFVLDVLSTIWIENIAVMIGKPEYYYVCQFNRLIRVYILFSGDYIESTNIKADPFLNISFRIVLTYFCFMYITGYFIFICLRFLPGVTPAYFYGENFCKGLNITSCDPGEDSMFAVVVYWTFELWFSEYSPDTVLDLYLGAVISFTGFIVQMYCKSKFVATLYLKYREVTNYQYFVTNLKKFYEHYKIHQDLMRRLDRYLICHWRYYKGVDVMHSNSIHDEPYDVYWKVHGELAEKIIGESRAFVGADLGLIRELAYVAKFLILPRGSTLFLFGVQCKNVTWLVQGSIKCEYHNEEGELLKVFYEPGEMLSLSAVFLGKASLRTYTSCTECEILYIKIQDFFNIIKRHPTEWSFFEKCIKEYAPVFDDMLQTYVKKHRDYQKRLRDRIFHARMSSISPTKKMLEDKDTATSIIMPSVFWTEPESPFIQYWMLFRSLTVVVSIVSASLQGGSGVVIRWPLLIISAFCDCVAFTDIIIKMFLAYYDERGLLIFDKRKCMLHYMTRGFIMDAIGALPWHEFLRSMVSQHIDDDVAMLINTMTKFAHIYILAGYFNYLANVPSVNVVFILILKWQVITLLVMLGATHFFMFRCIDYEFDDRSNLLYMLRLPRCWLPHYTAIDANFTNGMLHTVFAQSLNLAQCGLMRINLGKFRIDREKLDVGIIMFILGAVFWYVVCYSMTLLVLNSRGNTLFQHGLIQLRRFLQAERVEKKLINQAVAHFSYWWIRTKGINIQNLMNERIGVVFRQDLGYYFYRKTFSALDTLLHGGEYLERQLSSASTQLYFLPGQDIVREMDLTHNVFVVHRGKVLISQNGEKLAVLTKGGIFGPMLGAKLRPVRITASAEDYTDVLQIPLKQFQDIINDEIRSNIAQSPQSKYDYLPTRRHIHENPYNTVQYILRGRKTIQLPWMAEPMEAHSGNWYSRWLFLVWLAEPVVSATIVLILNTLPLDVIHNIFWILLMLDVIHLMHFLSEFFTMELVVVDYKCVKQRICWRRFTHWGCYADALSLLVPMLTFVTNNWNYQLARLLRLRKFHDYHFHFCRSFKSKAMPVLMKLVIVFLLLHAMTCGWIVVACRNDEFPIPIMNLPASSRFTHDTDEWIFPKNRKGGCARFSRIFKTEEVDFIQSFVVPKHWQADYLIAMTYIILLHTHTILDSVAPVEIGQIYYKIFIEFLIFLIDIWLMSVAISAIYTKYRELYQYDYNVENLTIYLKHTGVTPALLHTVKKYTKQLWRRQRGNWLPELAHQAPLCIREDLLGALYMHHLQTPPLFRQQLPVYFLRQLVARFQRIVIFPGKCIVKEGDIYSCMYFIHEGEVEKWYTDKNGESKMISLLSTNGYFGFIPGLFPNVPYQFTYTSRTVVDLVYLRYRDWTDLIDGYPDVKENLYAAAKQFKKEFGMTT